MSREEAVQSIMAILIIGIIAIVAMKFEIDGNILSLCIVAIAGLGGFELYQRTKELRSVQAQVPPGEKVPKD